MADQFWEILHQAINSGSKSTVLKSLGWLVGLTIVGAIGSFRYGTPLWFANSLAGLCLVSVMLYLIAYVYFAITDKDALRSEKFSIQKLAIQKGFIGDDQTGYIKFDKGTPGIALPAADVPQGTEESR